jgi:Virulence-associated protein E
VHNWLHTYVGAEDTPYTRAVGKLFLVAAVRRVRHPGVKYDHVMVLVGPQEKGKSSTGDALVPVDGWFDDGLVLGSEPKIVLEQTAGKWIMEINEMRGGKETEAVKAMITRRADTARKAYGEEAATVRRQFVMIGTTDKKDGFLNDPAGNQRYLPIEIGEIDLDALRRDRDQLWAEAAIIEASNEMPKLVLPPDVREAAKEAQRKHEMTDPVYETLAKGLGDFGGTVSMETLYAAVGAERINARTPTVQWGIKNSMARLGWEIRRVQADGARQRVYHKSNGIQFRFYHQPGSGEDGRGAAILSDPLKMGFGDDVTSMNGQRRRGSQPDPQDLRRDGAAARAPPGDGWANMNKRSSRHQGRGHRPRPPLTP